MGFLPLGLTKKNGRTPLAQASNKGHYRPSLAILQDWIVVYNPAVRSPYLLLVVLLVVWAVAPLAYPGTFQTHSGLLPVYNLIDLHAKLTNPAALVGWRPVFASSFDLFRTEGALPFVLAEFWRLVGLAPLDAVKLTLGLALAGSGIAFFALIRHLLEKQPAPIRDGAALLGAVLFVYMPYHLAAVYVRGALAESVTWAFAPLALLGLASALDHPARRSVMWASLGFAAVWLSTPGLSLFLIPVALALALFRSDGQGQRRQAVSYTLAVGVLGFGIGTLLDLPALIRYRFAFRQDGFVDAFVHPFQLVTASWGGDIPSGSFLTQFPFQFGIASLALVILAVALAGRAKETLERRWVLAGLSLALAVVILILPALKPLWYLTGLNLLLDAPWELLLWANVGVALAASMIIAFEPRLTNPGLLAAVLGIPLLASYSYLAPSFIQIQPAHPPVAVFEDEIMLLDYHVLRPSGTVYHGATVQVEMSWQALKPVSQDYTVFFQAVDESGRVWGQTDARPQDGAMPTIKWTPGRIITDTHSLQVDLDGPREGYTLLLGLYTPRNNERALTGAGGTEIEILPNP